MRFFSKVILIKSTSFILYFPRRIEGTHSCVVFQGSSCVGKGEVVLKLDMRLGGVSAPVT